MYIATNRPLVSDGDRQTNLMDSLQWLVNTYGYEGVNIDFENVAPADRWLLDGWRQGPFAAHAIAPAVIFLTAREGPLRAARIKEILGTSRKYAIPLLEYLDAAGFTRRRGDVRELVG